MEDITNISPTENLTKDMKSPLNAPDVVFINIAVIAKNKADAIIDNSPNNFLFMVISR